MVAYRIVQEALANVRAHARASRVAVRLEEVDGGVLARVSDDGVGFPPAWSSAAPPATSASSACASRPPWPAAGAALASAPGMGTTVEAWLPPRAGGLAGGPAAVEDQGGAVDEGGGVGAEEQDRVGDLAGLQRALDGGLGEHDPLDHLGLGDAVDPRLVGDLALDQGVRT